MNHKYGNQATNFSSLIELILADIDDLMLMAWAHDEAFAGFHLHFHAVTDGFRLTAQDKEHFMRIAMAMPGGLAARFEDFQENTEWHLIPDRVRDHGEVICVLVRNLEGFKIGDAAGDDGG